MSIKMSGFAQSLARCLDFDVIEPEDLETALQDGPEPLIMKYVEPSVSPPIIQSGMPFRHLVFVQHGTIVPWQYPHSELDAPFLIGEHEFLTDSERWVGSYSAVTDAIIVDIPVKALEAIIRKLPAVRERMHQLVMRRLARFYWTSLATSGTSSSRVAAALISRLALVGDDYGEDRRIEVKQKDLVRLTTMSRSAVADGLATLMDLSAISQGDDPPARFSGVVSIPDVNRLKDCAFAEVRDRTIQPLMWATNRP